MKWGVVRFPGSLDFEQDIFADFDARDVFEAETLQRTFNRTALRVENSHPGRHEHSYLQLKSSPAIRVSFS